MHKCYIYLFVSIYIFRLYINPLNANLNPICHLLALLGAHPILHVSRIRVNVYMITSTARVAAHKSTSCWETRINMLLSGLSTHIFLCYINTASYCMNKCYMYLFASINICLFIINTTLIECINVTYIQIHNILTSTARAVLITPYY
jgi:hypothetical protein